MDKDQLSESRLKLLGLLRRDEVLHEAVSGVSENAYNKGYEHGYYAARSIFRVAWFLGGFSLAALVVGVLCT